MSDSENISLKNLVSRQREEHKLMEAQLEWVKAERNYIQEKASYVNFIDCNQDKTIIGNSMTNPFTFTSISF